jgi:putative flippase GtrA
MIGWTVVSSTVVSWLLAVSFAFITNKIWVFESKTWNKESVIKEVLSFFLCRIMTGILDLIIMIVSVKILGWNDILMKAISNIAVIMLNYIASKLFIFRG